MRMETNEHQPLPDQRQIIHDLTLQKRATGLSPPEQEILEQLEAEELPLSETRSNDLLREYLY